jgi:hypothetical protein
MEAILAYLLEYWLFFVIVIGTVFLMTLTYIIYNAIIRSRPEVVYAASGTTNESLDETIEEDSEVIIDPEFTKITDSENVSSVEAVKEAPNLAEQEKKTEHLTETKEPSTEVDKKATEETVAKVPIVEEINDLPPSISKKDMVANIFAAMKVDPETVYAPLPQIEPEIAPKIKAAPKKKLVAKTSEPTEPKPKAKKKTPPKYHVLFRAADEKWYVKREGSNTILRVLETHREAVSVATIKALSTNSAVVVHRKDGRIRKAAPFKDVIEAEEEE